MSDSAPPPPPEQPSGSQPEATPPAAAPPPPPPAGSAPPPASPYGAPAPPMGQPMVTGPQPGNLLDRFLARLIDGILLGIVGAVIVGVVIVGALMGSSGGYGFGATGSYAAAAVSAVVTTLIYLGYFVFLESSRGQTIGKMVMKLHVHGPDGGKPTAEQAFKRNIWMAAPILGVIPIIGGIVGSLIQLVAVIMIAVGINSDPVKRQPWTDKFAGGTEVVKEG